MAKKKSNRQKHQKDVCDTSEEESSKAQFSGKCCPHVARAVNFGQVKRGIKKGSFNSCSTCNSSDADNDDLSEVWLCLQCGFRGCGRTSKDKHSLQHYKTIHSDCHSLVLSPSSGAVWCYDCDDEVQLQCSRSLKQCVEYIMKLKNTDVSKNKINTEIPEEKKISTVLPDENSLKDMKKLGTRNSESSPKRNDSHGSSKMKKDVVGKFPVKGLRNLGNTCYFNSVMQNLSQTPLLFCGLEEACSSEYRFEVPTLVVEGESTMEKPNTETLKLPLLKEYSLVHSFFQFLKRMMQNKAGEIINPNDIFGELQKKAPHFQNYLQQDSHELLRQFLDGIRQDEVKRQRKAILKHFNIGNSSSEITDDTRKLIKVYGTYASHSIIDKIFGGTLISTVVCEECQISSQVFEPFMDMSLPVFEEKPTRNQSKVNQTSDENDEYVLSKGPRDSSKPSKHQEKKMKMLEKKEKKKNKKLQNRSGPSKENEATTTTTDVKTSEMNGDIATERSTDDDEEDVCMEIEPLLGSVYPDERLSLPNETPSVNDHGDSHKSSMMSSDDKSIVLFDEVVFIDEDPPSVTTRDLTEEDEKQRDDNHTSEPKSTIPSLVNHKDKSINLSDISALELDEHMQALSLQVKEVRIRKDSDRQESILSSSNPASDDERASSKANFASDDSANEDDQANNSGNWSQNLSQSESQEWLRKSLSTLGPRRHVSPLECSVDTCLSHFTKPELLMGSNKFRCETCTERKRRKTGDKKAVAYSNASKQLLVFSPPAVLTLHLKRFQQIGMSLRKVNRFVEFPLKLDLAPYCSSASVVLPHMSTVKNELLYSLYGIVEHSGRLTSGHYTAFVKVSKRTLYKNFLNRTPLALCDLEHALKNFSRQDDCAPDETKDPAVVSESRQWFYISDSQVKEVSEATVLKCQAYLLFYERIK